MSAALIIAEALLRYGPGVARGIAEIFNKPAPTIEDWNAIFDLAEKSYEAYVGGSPPSPRPSPPGEGV